MCAHPPKGPAVFGSVKLEIKEVNISGLSRESQGDTYFVRSLLDVEPSRQRYSLVPSFRVEKWGYSTRKSDGTSDRDVEEAVLCDGAGALPCSYNDAHTLFHAKSTANVL